MHDLPGEEAGILAAVSDASDDAIIVTDLDAVVVTWSRGATRLYGYTPEEMVGRSIGLLVPEGNRGEVSTMLQQARAGERTCLDTVGRTKQGHVIDVAVTVSPVPGAGGAVTGAAVVARDVTRQRRDERALRATEARWRAVVESAVDGIIVIDAKGCIEALNPAAERLFGYAEAEALGRNVSMLMPEPYHSGHDGYLARYLREGAARIIGVGREVTGQRKDGTTFPLHLSVGEMSVGGERKFTGILHDRTSRVRLEEQMREQAALAKLGEMAAVIAHEVRNPLAGIRGAIQIISGRLPSDGQEAMIVREMLTRIDALGELMSDLLLFARPPQPKPVPIEIARLVSATVDLLKADPGVGRVVVAVEGSAPPIPVDPGLLRIVFLNLLVNGAHAMRGQGTITVSVTSSEDGCAVAFNDSGPGIPPDLRDKVFMPFFTTKSRGTGLGLPTAKRLVEAHQGTIRIDCPSGGGTTVTVRLPAH